MLQSLLIYGGWLLREWEGQSRKIATEKQNLRNKVYESPFQYPAYEETPIAIVKISSTHLITNLLPLSVSPLYWLFSERCNTLICSLIFFSVMKDIFWSVNMSSSTSDDIALQSLQSLHCNALCSILICVIKAWRYLSPLEMSLKTYGRIEPAQAALNAIAVISYSIII